MAFGFEYGSSGEDFNDIVKYNAKEGRFYRIDRSKEGNTEEDITTKFKAIFDMENLEVGWIKFAADSAPDFNMVPIRTPMPERPSSKHKKGMRLMVKLSKECGGSVREIAGNSNVIMTAFDMLDDDFLLGVKENPGKLPVIVLEPFIKVTTGSGETKATNFRPVFKISSWVARPDDLAPKAKGEGKTKEEPVQEKSPPQTGAKKVTHETAPASADADDFG